MNLQGLLSSVHARRKIFFITLLISTFLALAATTIASRSYKAVAMVILNFRGTDPLTGSPMPVQLIPGFIANQLDIIKSNRVALRVVDDLHLIEHPAFREAASRGGSVPKNQREEVANFLLQKLDVTPAREGSIVEISYKHRDPGLAAVITNGFVAAYQRSSVDLKSEPLRQTASFLEQQVNVLRGRLEQAQRKLSEYQKENDMVSLGERVDVENARLNDLISQLVTAQAQTTEAAARTKQAHDGGATESQEAVQNHLVQTLKEDLSRKEAELVALANSATTEYPRYQAAKAQVNKLRSDLRRQIRIVDNSVSSNASALARREVMLREMVEAQKSRVQALNQARDEFLVLEKEAQAAQQAYDSTAKRFNEINLESRSNESDVAVIDWAALPSNPMPRNVLRITLPLILLGTLLGLALTLLAEWRDHRVRSRDDLVVIARDSALGVFEWAADKAPPSTLPLRQRLLLLSRRILPLTQ